MIKPKIKLILKDIHDLQAGDLVITYDAKRIKYVVKAKRFRCGCRIKKFVTYNHPFPYGIEYQKTIERPEKWNDTTTKRWCITLEEPK